MKVTLLAYTPNPADIAEISAKTCYSSKPPSEIEPTEDKKVLSNALLSGHTSVLEHAVFTFSIEGISRACSHQLVRHRMASFSQQSQRYVAMDDDIKSNFILPDSFERAFDFEGQNGMGWGSEGCLENFVKDYFIELHTLVERARKCGIPEEDIRYFYPNGMMTNIVVTMNARELLHFFSLRCCNRAQWEIKQLADSMLSICREVCPEIFKYGGANCEQLGYCPEVKSCGRKETLTKIMDGVKK
jgi:thymidylate synthase (FAD)